MLLVVSKYNTDDEFSKASSSPSRRRHARGFIADRGTKGRRQLSTRHVRVTQPSAGSSSSSDDPSLTRCNTKLSLSLSSA